MYSAGVPKSSRTLLSSFSVGDALCGQTRYSARDGRINHDGRHRMKQTALVTILSAAVLLASPACAQFSQGASGPAKADDTVPGGADATSRPDRLPPDPEGKAEDLRLNGHCDQALPIFRRLAARGPGYEIAQYNLGLCLLDVSKADPDAQHAASVRAEAAENIIKAANGGLPKAQSSLVVMYLDGNGVERDPVQAGMWALIYHANGARMAIGLPNIPDSLQARLDTVLTAETWRQAQSRADAWNPIKPNLDN
jgi:hypothetical protein